MTTTELNMFALSTILREGMNTGRMPYLKVSSGSMLPLLRIGDEVGIQPVQACQLQPGDVIVLTDANQILTHRFVRLRYDPPGQVIVTQGDRARVPDRPWSETQLLGRVVVRRRQNRILWLDFGAGQRLNRMLATLSSLQRQILELVRDGDNRSAITIRERIVLGAFRQLTTALTKAAELALWRD